MTGSLLAISFLTLTQITFWLRTAKKTTHTFPQIQEALGAATSEQQPLPGAERCYLGMPGTAPSMQTTTRASYPCAEAV